MKTLDVILRNSALCANLVNKSGDEAYNCICNVIVLRVLKPTFSVITLCNTACNTMDIKKKKEISEVNNSASKCI